MEAGGNADGDAGAWTFLRRLGAYGAAWAAAAPIPSFEDAPFPIRIQSAADLGARDPWGLLAWENPFAPPGPAGPFWNAPMLDAEGSATATPLMPLLAASGARLDGLRLRDGALVLRIGRGGRAAQLRLARDGPLLAGGGLRLWHDFGLELPVSVARLADLLGVLGRPAPRRGRVRRVRNRNF